MDSCALVSTGHSGSSLSIAPAAWQAVRWGLPQAHWQRCSTVSCLPPPEVRGGPAGHRQPYHAHLSSLPGSLAVTCRHLVSHQPAAASTAPCRSPPRRRQAGPMAAISRVGQPMAALQTAGHHAILGSINFYLFSIVWQPAARGHWAYTDLSAARVRGPALCTSCSLVNWEMTHSYHMVLYPLLDMRGGGSLCKLLEGPGGFRGSAGHRCLRSGHNRSNLGGITKISPCHREDSNRQPSA